MPHLARSSSLFSDSSLTAANQISSLFGLAWKAKARIDRAAEMSPYMSKFYTRSTWRRDKCRT